MKYAYIILAHKSPNQLSRLINRLTNTTSEVDFYIHIDKKSAIQPFKKILENQKSIYWLKQRNSKWGSFNLVQVVLDALTLQQKLQKKYIHTLLLSGQDYPIKSIKFLENFLEKNKEKSFIEFQKLPVTNLKDGGLDRFSKWHFYFGNHKITFPLYDKHYGLKDRIISKFLSLFLSQHRQFNQKYSLYYGSQWWILNQNTVDYILEFINKNSWYIDYFKYVWISDEHFFQTILLNHSNYNFKECLVNDNMRYIEWGKPGRMPAVLTMDDYHLIDLSEKLFARKFDQETDIQIIDAIDQSIENG